MAPRSAPPLGPRKHVRRSLIVSPGFQLRALLPLLILMVLAAALHIPCRQLAREVSSVYVLQYDKEYIGEEDTELYRKISEELKKLDKDLVRETVALKDFEFVFDCIDVRGRRRKAKVTRYRRPVPDG